jgi:uracil-DNA glycosylase family 4
MPASTNAADGLQLTDAYISMAVRCAPPDNKPLPEEITRCLDHLEAEVSLLSRATVVVALGKIAFDAWLRILKHHGIATSPRPQFGHGEIARFDVGETTLPPVLVGCYHPSRQNTNTGKLTMEMIVEVFRTARRILDS